MPSTDPTDIVAFLRDRYDEDEAAGTRSQPGLPVRARRGAARGGGSLDRVTDERDVCLTAADAERYLGIPASSVRTWAKRSKELIAANPDGELPAVLTPVRIHKDGRIEYSLAELLAYRKHAAKRPTRRQSLTTAVDAIRWGG